jgi:hypothetical protein
MDNNTAKRLAEMTDEGVFERLATAVLREADPRYAALAHPGVNVDGKTVRAPVDGIAYVAGSSPPHFVAAHHTTTAAAGLAAKWLHDPSTVKPRKGKPTAPPGDLLKTAEIVQQERERDATIVATLALTANQEPSEQLVRDANSEARKHGIALDIWARSRLAHFLDSPQGQWLRNSYLGIEQVKLSKDLLGKLSRDSLHVFQPPGDDPDAWVDRAIDTALSAAQRDIVLLVADAGLGKSVASYKQLRAHVERGGFGIVLPHDLVESSPSFIHAIDLALRQLHPHLAPDAGADALPLCEPALPFLVVVEDINRSGEPSALLERIASWHVERKGKHQGTRWRLICPAWPQALFPLKDQQRKQLDAFVLSCPTMTPDESCTAVLRRATLCGRTLSTMDAGAIAEALGHDPLLIALHDFAQTPDPHSVIARFIDSSIERTVPRAEFTAADYAMALKSLSQEMLKHRKLTPSWNDVLAWFGAAGAVTGMLRRLTRQGEIIRIVAGAGTDHIAFRHDRVRDALLTAMLAAHITKGTADHDLLRDPYFAEMLGTVLVDTDEPEAITTMLEDTNPLALFYALARAPRPSHPAHAFIVAAILRFLASPAGQSPSRRHLRWYALYLMSRVESPAVKGIVMLIAEQNWFSWAARFLNGDVGSGLALSSFLDPGTSNPWRDRFMEHVKLRYGRNLTNAIRDLLCKPDLPDDARVGALRIAAYLADPILADAIETSWSIDTHKHGNLADYLVTSAYCCGDEAERLLAPLCVAWAALPSRAEDDSNPSGREDLAAHGVRFAFRRRPPVAAIPYLIARAKKEDLRWPITYLLHEVDNPDTLEFTARETAATQSNLEGKGGFSPFVSSVADRWSRPSSYGEGPMSRVSKERLLSLWQNPDSGKHLTQQAFRLWAASHSPGDLEILQAIDTHDGLFDMALFERLERGDHSAIPAFEEKLRHGNERYWWQAGRYIWSDRLTAALEESLARRGEGAERSWQQKDRDVDWITSEMMTRLPVGVAEGLLLKHWDHLRFSHVFVHVALFTAAESLLPLVAQTMAECPDRAKAMEHVDLHYGIGYEGRGVTRLAQLESLLPYLQFLKETTIIRLSDACNAQGWLQFRRKHLDPLVKTPSSLDLLDDETVFKALDDMIEKDRLYPLDWWADRYRRTGATLDDIMGVLGRWLQTRRTMASLRLVANGVSELGQRRHLDLLNISDIEPEQKVASLLEDTAFAVKRRTLE